MIAKKWMIPVLIISLLLTSCFVEEKKWKEELQQALLKLNNVNSYEFHGSVNITSPGAIDVQEQSIVSQFFLMLSQSEWKWEGKTMQSPLQFDGTITIDSKNLPFKLKDNQAYFQLPFFVSNQYYYIDITSEQVKSSIFFDRNKIYEIVNQSNVSDIKQIDNNTISVRLDSNNKQALESFAMLLEPLQPILVAPGMEASDFLDITFTINEEGYLTSETYLWQAGEQTVEWTQHYSNWNTPLNMEVPDDAISFAELWQKAKQLQEKDQMDAYELFTPSVNLQVEYPDDTEEAAIISLLKTHLTALIEKNRDTFLSHFRSTSFADKHQHLLESERKYQFIGVEDLSSKNVNNSKQLSVRVLYNYIDPGKKEVNVSGFIYTLYKNSDNVWTVQTIK